MKKHLRDLLRQFPEWKLSSDRWKAAGEILCEIPLPTNEWEEESFWRASFRLVPSRKEVTLCLEKIGKELVFCFGVYPQSKHALLIRRACRRLESLGYALHDESLPRYLA